MSLFRSRAGGLNVREAGSAVIFKNNRPKYLLVDLSQEALLELTDDEKIEIVAKRILEKHRKAFEELAR
ncbi:hypothetical protein Spico_0195 [Parasphaerochaeta coccoides DSM 17374]|uniref:Uncharacterized protein n=1 Tax=Parasphaerochaeta coccoides (strain ATCC BAA-1237 / DSM 17374 / SPN1) TaxID=760011 RepID=F4GKM3_PARC1|nr:hypothetical protein Spico_0195 [Parasphaerochaeta coccoides DSM 17374]